jgi:hypothetical protein
MEGTTLGIENSSRAHAESLNRVLSDYETDLVHDDGSWRVEVELGELTQVLLELFDTIGSWFDAERVESLLLSFGERQYPLLRPSKSRVYNSNAFLLERCAQLETALQTRIVIEQAKGIVSRTLDIGVEHAFDLLRKSVRDRGMKLQDLAAKIVAGRSDTEKILAGQPDV